MAFMNWATHVLQKQLQRVTIKKFGVNLEKLLYFGLFSEIREHEGGIASNRKLVRFGEYYYMNFVHTARHAMEVSVI